MSLKNRFKQQPTVLQDKVLNFLKRQSYSIIVGEAGSSKDWICLFYALNALYNKEITKIIISKPLVEVGSSVGYLPGPQPITSHVLTPSGWRQIASLQIGEEVITPCGKTSTIVNKSAINKEPVYEVRTSDGRVMHCATNHLFHTMTFNDKKHRTDKKKFIKDYNGSVKSLTEIINTFKTVNNKINHYIPYPKPCEFINTTKKIIPPYTMGVLLGDGYMKGVSFSNIDDELVNKVKSEISNDLIEITHSGGICYKLKSNAVNNKPGKNIIIDNIDNNQTTTYKNINTFYSETNSHIPISTLNHRCKHNQTIDSISYSYGIKEAESTNIYKDEIIRLGLIDKLAIDKFIPKEYIYNSSVEERTELLRGLLDTDGTNDKKAAAYTTISNQLKDDVIDLVRSLGGRATCYTRNRIGKTTLHNGRNITTRHISYEIVINLDINPFFISRKASKYNPSYKHLIGIKEINKIENDYVQCIEIDSKDGLYITDDFVVTHNSETDKFQPYAESMIEIVQGLLGHAEASKLINAKQIVFKPLQFIRGSTYNDACIILSEAQNATLHQLVTLMTRKGSRSNMFFNGDLLQADIPNSGLKVLMDILKIPEVGIMELGEEYQMREKTITIINRLYRKYLEENPSSRKRERRK